MDAEDDVSLEELRALFRRHAVPFGRPEDLLALPDRARQGGALEGEVLSHLGAIVQRGREQLSRGEVMRLVVLAGGGPTVTPHTAALQPALRQIAQWVNTAFQEAERTLATGTAREAAISEPGPEGGGPSAGAEPGTSPGAHGRTEAIDAVAGDRRQRRWPRSVGRLRAKLRGARPGAAASGGPTSAMRRPRSEATRNGWVPALLVFLAAGGVLGYLLWPVMPRTVGARSAVMARPAGKGAGPAATKPESAGPRPCVGPIRGGVSRAGIEERAQWAHKMLDGGIYPVAFSQLRGLQAVNPGYPGVLLDQSEALLRMGQLDGARAAVETQVRISACLASLPGEAVDAYCREEFPPADVAVCRPTMERIGAAAELQAAIVHLELANRMHPDERSLVALAALSRIYATTERGGEGAGTGERLSTDEAGSGFGAGAGFGVRGLPLPASEAAERRLRRRERRLRGTSSP